MANRIHIFGASGSGTSTLGQAVASTLGIPFLDTDTFYWKVTDPPFTDKHPPAARLAMIADTVRNTPSWVLSGSLSNWGDPLLKDFTLAVFLYLDPDLRLQRLAEREQRRYGARINAGGDMWQIHRGFMAWAESYDTARAPTRSLHLHNQWRTRLACPLLDLDSSQPLTQLVATVVTAAAATERKSR